MSCGGANITCVTSSSQLCFSFTPRGKGRVSEPEPGDSRKLDSAAGVRFLRAAVEGLVSEGPLRPSSQVGICWKTSSLTLRRASAPLFSE